jgi:predicted RNA-binding Zn ribbon-like protein
MAKRTAKTADQKEMLSPIPGGIQARAMARVGGNDLARLAWLLDLLNRAPETFAVMAELDRAELEAEVTAFCKPVGKLVGGQQAQLSADEAHELVRDIHARVVAMLQGSTFELEIPRITLSITSGEGTQFMGEPSALFRLAVARLIEVEGQRIKFCARPGCGRLFVRRKRALYCQRQCSQLEQFARYVARHAPKTISRSSSN